MLKKNWIVAMASMGLLAAGSVAQACTLGAWTGGTFGDAVLADVDANGNAARYSGLCAMEATTGGVLDLSPGGEQQARFRFYFRGQNVMSDTTIFQAYSDEPPAGPTPVLSVIYDGTNVRVQSDLAGGAATGLIPAANNTWHSIEVDWGSTTAGTLQVWVNKGDSNPADGTAAIGGSGELIESAHLGPVAGNAEGAIIGFDDYQMNRTTSPNRICIGDANGNGTVAISDAIGVVNEVIGVANNTGSADCTLNGSIAISDAVCMVNIVIGVNPNCAAQ